MAVLKKKFKSMNTSKIVFHNDSGVMVDVNMLKLWKDNPKYNKDAVAPLAKLFKMHGVRSTVVAWRKNMTIYKGNTTYKALCKLGCKQIPVSVQDFSSEAAAKAYGISDNKSSEYAQWDEDVLLSIMEADNMDDFREATGFKESELEKMMRNQNRNTVSENNTSLPQCIIKYHPNIKDNLMQYIQKTVARKFGEQVIIKF